MLSISLGPIGLSLVQGLLVGAFLFALAAGVAAGRKEKGSVVGALLDIFLGALIFARLGFVALYFEHYQHNLWEVIDIRDGGFSLLSGVFGAAVVTVWKLWRCRSIRRPVSIAVLTGLLGWGALSLLVGVMEKLASTLPEADFARLDGSVVSLQELANGRPMVVNLWASWCPPCVREMPVLEEAQRAYPGIAFVFVNQGEYPETIRAFIRRQELELENILTDTRGALGRAVGSQVLPTTLFYDSSGRQVGSHIGMLSRASLAHKLKSLATNEVSSGEEG